MKTAIAFEDLRVGDLVECEWSDMERVIRDRIHHLAERSATTTIGDRIGRSHDKWFLIERPAPTVELPTEPTLGWLNDAPYLLAVWYPAEVLGTAGVSPVSQTPFSADHIAAFTPAVAVPASALDELRKATALRAEEYDVDTFASLTRRAAKAADKFLTAVDEANR